MKNRTVKMIVNGGVLAAMAALGITVFQLGTSPVKEAEENPETPVQMVKTTEQREQEPMVDVGNSNVEAELESEAEDLLKEDAQTDILESAEIQEESEFVDTSAAVTLPEVNFSEDTLMEWPVSGDILVDYSMEHTTYFPTLDQYRLSPAIAVQATEGEPVRAAASGTVFSIEESAQTGTTVTMELGNSYQAIYGQLTGLLVSEGDTVAEGDIIGYIAAPTKYYSVEGSNLYFAMKRNSEPIDPIVYLP